MKRKYIKIVALILTTLALFGGIGDVKARDSKSDAYNYAGCPYSNTEDYIVFKYGTCKYYGKYNKNVYEILLTGKECGYIIGKDGENDFLMFDRHGTYAKKSTKDLKADYDSNGCPSKIVYTTDTGWFWGDAMEIGFGYEGSKIGGDGDWKNHLVLYNVSDEYYDAKDKSKQSNEPGVDVQINEMNDEIKPYFESLYNLLSGTGTDYQDLHTAKINGKDVTLKLYDGYDSTYGYADVISVNFKVRQPSRHTLENEIEYTSNASYVGENNENNLRNADRNKLMSLANWSIDALDAYTKIGEMYNATLELEKEIKKITSQSSALYKWGSGTSGKHRPLLANQTTYSGALDTLVKGANNNTAKYSWLDDAIKDNSANHSAYEKVRKSVTNFSKYLQFNVQIGEGDDKTTLLAQWATYLENDIATYTNQIENIIFMCDAGYSIAKEKKYTDVLDKFTECKSNSKVVSKNFKTSASKFRTAIKSLSNGGFNWREEDVVVTCDNLLGTELINALSNIYFFIEVVVVIICVILSMVDLFKAVSNSDADALKKAWSSIVKRIIVILALFLLPVIIEFTLKQFGVVGNNDNPICIDAN